MKKFFLLLLYVVACTFSFAQINKGTLMIGGNTNVRLSSSKDNTFGTSGKAREISLAPSIGYAVHRNLLIGVGSNYGRIWYPEIDQPKENYEQRLGGFIFLRKYATLGRGFFLFAEPSIYYNKTMRRGLWQQITLSRDGWNAGLGLYPGVAYAVNRKLHLELGMSQLIRINYERNVFDFRSPNNPVQFERQSSWNAGINNGQSTPFTLGARIVLAK